jgi:hypothetical protein
LNIEHSRHHDFVVDADGRTQRLLSDEAMDMVLRSYAAQVDAATVGLLGAAVAVAGTLGGSVFTQVRSDQRDQVRLASEERREEHRLDVEAVRGREARLFDHRRGALLQVIEKYHVYADLAWNVENRTTDDAPGDDELEPLWQLLSQVDLYCGKESARLAREVYHALSAWLHGSGPGTGAERQRRAEEAFREFLAAARAELGVPPEVDKPANERGLL